MRSTDYEALVARVYADLLPTGLGNVLKNQQYIGKRSGHSHQIDVAIEMKIAGLQILVVIECKYYNRRVEIGEVLELAERLDDIGAQKGVLVTRIGFQAGALKVARARSIALVVTEPMWEVVLYAPGVGGLIHNTRIVERGQKPSNGKLVAEDVKIFDGEQLSIIEISLTWREIILRHAER